MYRVVFALTTPKPDSKAITKQIEDWNQANKVSCHTLLSAFLQGKQGYLLTSRNTLALSDVLHVPTIRVNLIFVALLSNVRVKVFFEFDKIVMTKNNVFMGKGYCDHGLFVLNLSRATNESISMYMIDLYGMRHAILGHTKSFYIIKLQSLGLINLHDKNISKV
uniref:Retrovirus-related Pol polyprotein from transposon TNT 1-94 n=1 Tax=Cajanus cajan TaxID=3821 RepID=A0A151TNU2_CAJCA|nr:hypothetical protein KK1_022375 [Cajanus cajan]